MNLTKMRLLIAGWWCATVIPGLAVALLDREAAINGSGAVVAVWIVGYVVQLFLFMAVSRRLKGISTSILLWFVVSLLPFAIDWGVGINWWAVVAFVMTAVAIAGYVDLSLTRTALLQRDGIRATAVVLEVKKPLMNVVVNNVYIKRKLRIRVDRDDNAPSYETLYSDLFMLGSVPSPGDSFRVVVDPQKPAHVAAADDSGGSTTRSAGVPARAGVPGSDRKNWKFTSWRTPGSSSARRAPAYQPYQPAAPHVRDVVSQIRELAELHERGQLTDAEFARAKQELLGGDDSAPPE